MAFKLFPKVRRVPTIIGLFILVIGIAATTYLSQSVQQFFLKAGPTISPQNVKISNLTQESFTVSWITPDTPSSGYIKYGKSSSLGKVGLDERDQKIETLGQYTVHHVAITSLEPQTTYYFKIVSQEKEYGERGVPYSTNTAPADYPATTLAPTYGMILEETGQPAKEGIVYVKIGNSNPASTLIKPSGNWLISLSPLTGQDFKNPLNISPDDPQEIFVQGKTKTSKTVTSVKNNAPVPTITLGQDFDFRATASPSPTPTAGLISPATTPLPSPPSSSNFEVSTPASGAAIPGQPFFRGTGSPGKKIQITVESEAPVSGEVTVDPNGNWSWQAPTDLTPGEHTVTVMTTDDQDNPQTIIRKFIVLASGTQVVEAATPSATPTSTPQLSPPSTPTPTAPAGPTATPTPTATLTPTPTPLPKPSPTLTLTPTPKATTTPVPTSGDLLLTLVLAAGGLSFITFGFFLQFRTTK